MADRNHVTTHDVYLAGLNAYSGLRHQFIEQRGMDVIFRSNQMVNIKDEMGDIINESTYVDSRIKLVFNLVEYYSVLNAYLHGTNENGMTLRAACDLALVVRAGDRVRFTHQLIPGIHEDKEWQVVDVPVQIHVQPVSKALKLAPLRDV